jgi:pimeloyl-ACP methyl ester carboxylesterase
MSPVTELRRRELLREMLARRAKQASEDQPTSVGQRALWMFDQLHPGSPAYHLSGAARVEGPFDVDTMRAAFQQVVDRHPALRTGLVLVDGELKQRVATTMPADFTVTDLSGLSPSDVDRAVTDFTERPFNLATGPVLRAHYAYLPAGVREVYDVVAFDPRGAGQSTPVQGFASPQEAMELFAGLPVPFPVNDTEGQIWVDKFAPFVELVRSRNADLVPHITTANTARDLDRLRELLGEDTIAFFGVSYGSLVGTTYANMFPDRVRAMVLDGTIDPVNWFTDDNNPDLNTTLRVEFDVAAANGLDRFLGLAGSDDHNSFGAGSAEATRAKFQTLLERLRAKPAVLSTPDGEATVTYPMLVANMWVVLYQVAYWRQQAEILQEIWLATEPGGEGRMTSLDVTARPGGADVPPLYASPPEQSLALLGGDAPNPTDPRSWFAQGKLAEERAGGMGLVVSWGSVATAYWPTNDNRYTGPWDKVTAGPMLLVGVTGDPGTPYGTTARLVGSIPNARLLTVEGEGHTVHYNPEPAVHDVLTAYLVDGVLPEPGATLTQRTSPFPA